MSKIARNPSNPRVAPYEPKRTLICSTCGGKTTCDVPTTWRLQTGWLGTLCMNCICKSKDNDSDKEDVLNRGHIIYGLDGDRYAAANTTCARHWFPQVPAGSYSSVMDEWIWPLGKRGGKFFLFDLSSGVPVLLGIKSNWDPLSGVV